jgi:flavin-dependent thymidylate synthase
MIFSRDKLKDLFSNNSSKIDKQLVSEANRDIRISYNIISNTESAFLCSMAAKTCYGLTVENSYEKCLAHIKRVMGYGHDSICGHSNIIALLCFKSNNSNLSDFDLSSIYTSLSALHFMNIVPLDFLHAEGTNEYFALLSGSIRAFRYFIQNSKLPEDIISDNETNFNFDLYRVIVDIAKHSIEKEFFEDMKDYVDLDEFKYKYPYIDDNISFTEYDRDTSTSDDVDRLVYANKNTIMYSYPDLPVVYNDILSSIADYYYADEDHKYLVDEKTWIYKVNKEQSEFLMDAVFKCITVSFKFKNFSRAISQQVNRHLCAISQESQRYVDYSKKALFVDPLPFNSKAYPDKDKKYNFKFGDKEFSMSSEELGESIIAIYPQLKKQGMINQDARAFLPMNVATNAMYTFTLENLLHFIKVRDSQYSQQEVQLLAKQLEDILERVQSDCFDNEEIMKVAYNVGMKLYNDKIKN